ncbi:hypothetical protein VTO73DRAFT_1160 [Trametes versicolor]
MAAARAARHAPTDFAFCDSLCTTDPPEPACTDVANSIEPADCSATRDTYHRVAGLQQGQEGAIFDDLEQAQAFRDPAYKLGACLDTAEI